MGMPAPRTDYPLRPLAEVQIPKGKDRLPVISRFYGIVVYMHFRDHDPPHFHARYQEHEVLVEIESGLIKGSFPQASLATSG